MRSGGAWFLLLAGLGAWRCSGGGGAGQDAASDGLPGGGDACDLRLLDAREFDGGDGGLVCPRGSAEDRGQCRFPCPPSWDTDRGDGRCIPPCPAGWQRGEGGCSAPCPAGFEQVGPLCRPPFSDPLDLCIGEPYDPEGSEGSGTVVYVDEGTGGPSGDGTKEKPFSGLQQAVDALPAGADGSILIGPGTYEFPKLKPGPSAIRMLGNCAGDVVLTGDPGVTLPEAVLEVARVTLQTEPLSVYGCQDLILRRSILKGNAYVMWGGAGSLHAEGNRFELDGIGIWFMHGLEEAHIAGNEFHDAYIDLDGFQAVEISGNRFVGGGSDPIKVDGGSDPGDLLVSGNWFEGVVHGGVRVVSCAGKLDLIANSFLDGQGTAIEVSSCAGANLEGNRVSQVEAAADEVPVVSLHSVKGCRVAGTYIRGGGEAGVSVGSFEDVVVEGGYIAGCAGDAIDAGFSKAGAPGLKVKAAVLEGSGRGINCKSAAVKVEDTIVAGCKMHGIRLFKSPSAEVRNGFVVGNGSTGLDLSLLAGGAETEYLVAATLFQENVGMGVLVRSGGVGSVRLTENVIRGTRAGMLVNGGGKSGAVGDGIAVVTGSDGTPSTAVVEGNTLEGNSRLGMLAHGAGTKVEASGNAYAGNGASGSLEGVLDGKPDLVYQEGAEVGGSDAGLASVPSEPIVAGDNVELGTGGDPRL